MLRVAFTATPSTPANNPPTLLTGGSNFSDQMLGASSTLSILTTASPISLPHHWPSAFLRLPHHHPLTSSLPPIAGVHRHHLLLHPSRSNSHFPIKSSQQFNFQSTSDNLPSHPWPEWLELLESISVSGQSDGNRNMKDEFVPNESLSMEFVDAACCCLGFALDRPDLLGWLFKDDIQVLVNNGTPFLFKNAIETEKRMRSFLQEAESSEATTVDLMKYILSYASNPIFYPERIIKEDVESSARNLLREMANFNGRAEAVSTSAIEKVDEVGDDEQAPIFLETNITMKRGDWKCRKCSFMNFAENAKCLECEELRPQRQLTGREWDCPQCNFFNHGRNLICLKCESRRPGEVPLPVGQVKTPPIPKGTNSGYASFVPLPADMFAKKPENSTINNSKEAVTKVSEPKPAVSTKNTEKSGTQIESKAKDAAEEEKSERWFKKVAELHDVTDLASAISDDDFPDIMPMRKGESRFVVSKKKDRSLTSPTYKRQQAMEQGNDKSSFVPFVPFPPGYFAKQDGNQQSTSSHSHENSSKVTNDTNLVQEISGKDTNDMKVVEETRIQLNRQSARPETSNDTSLVQETSGKDTNDMKVVEETRIQLKRQSARTETSNGDGITPENQNVRNTSSKNTNDMNFVEETRIQLNRQSARSETSNGDGLTPENQNVRNGFKRSSLEGSAVKETDPLDMSEEAKAERWFRRVAQIKDISELSQIPDEDFPSIMPMRKGVNRFVVSKRKTPLERRLTSPQYRKNIRTVSSEPEKKEGDGN